MASSYQYSLIFDNQSSRLGDLCVFQQDPNLTINGLQTVAWLVKTVAATTRLTLTWTTDLAFTWSETGQLAPGVVGTSVQVWPADLSTTNQVTFNRVSGAYTFQDQAQGPEAGSMTILQSASIPADQAAVGIGMGGAATFYVQAQPNVTSMFTPSTSPQYWISFASYVAGEILDVDAIADKVEVVYPTNVYSMTATLESDNTWSIAPTAEVNAAYLAASADDPDVCWGAQLV
ncbi:MAG: protein rhiA [Acidobacteriota bacterium]